jgi:hypothetical protein
MIVFVLVVWFGTGNQQVAFSVPNIASRAECISLGDQMKRHYQRSAVANCYPYRAAVASQ